MKTLLCTESLLSDTIIRLKAGGTLGHERVVLWLVNAMSTKPAEVREIYEPQQNTAKDFFHIPPESMRALMHHLRDSRLKIAAQIHTHPREAFHSEADDRWAIIRHRGALSLVLPYFATMTTPSNFLEHVMVYELSAENRWEQVPSLGTSQRIGVTI